MFKILKVLGLAFLISVYLFGQAVTLATYIDRQERQAYKDGAKDFESYIKEQLAARCRKT